MSPPNCSGKVSPPKLGGGLESKAVTKVGGDRKRGRRASECEGGGRSVGAQRATGEAAQAGLRRSNPSWVLHGSQGRAPAHRTPEQLRQRVIELARGKDAGVNDTHLCEKLAREE